MLFFFCVAFWVIPRGDSYFIVLQCSLSSCFFLPFSTVINLLGEEGAGLYASRSFVLYVLVSFFFFFFFVFFLFLFLLVSAGGWLLFVIVALSGHFY